MYFGRIIINININIFKNNILLRNIRIIFFKFVKKINKDCFNNNLKTVKPTKNWKQF